MTPIETTSTGNGVDELASRIDALQSELRSTQMELAEARSDPPGATSEIERAHRKLRRAISGVGERQEAVDARLNAIEGSSRPDEATRAELKALRSQVTELHRSVAEVRQLVLRREKRRAKAKRVVTAPARALASPFRRRGKKRAEVSASRPRRGRRKTPRARARRVRLRMARFVRRTKARVRDRLFARRLGRLNHHDPKELKIPRRYRKPIQLHDPPVISIVTPSYNQGHFIERTILSVVDQDYPRLEYIIQDGGSTDETGEVLERHAERLHHYEMRDDDGHAHAINLGFAHSSGEVMAFLNSDDLLLPGSLHYVARYFERHPDVDAVYGHRVMVDENDMEIGRWVMPPHDDEVLSWADFVPQETLFWRRGIWERAGGTMDQEYPFALDWDLLLRLREAGAKTVRLPRFLGAFRIHEAQKTSAIMDTQGKQEALRLRHRVHGREVTRPEITKAVRPYLRRHHVRQKLYRMKMVRY